MYKKQSLYLVSLVSVFYALSQNQETIQEPDKQVAITNWAGNQTCKAQEIVYPESKQELITIIQDALKNKQKLKAIGSAHSWSDIMCGSDKLISLKKLNQVLSIDKENMLVAVQAGITLAELNEALEQQGLALSNQTAIRAQTLAGVMATATHGTGHTGTFANFIEQLELIAGNGKTYSLTLPDNPEKFAAASVNIGALGVIYSLTLKCEPQFALEHHSEKTTRKKILKNYKKLYKNSDFFSFAWNAFTDEVSVNYYTRRSIFSVDLDDNVEISYKALSSETVGDKRLEEEIGINAQYVPFVFSVLKKLFKKYKKQGYDISGRVLFRFVKADKNAYLSTAAGRDTVYLSISTPVEDKYLKFYQDFEYKMLQFEGRPHWGKINFLTHKKARKLYGKKLDKFISVAQELDPEKLFSNAFTQRVLR